MLWRSQFSATDLVRCALLTSLSHFTFAFSFSFFKDSKNHIFCFLSCKLPPPRRSWVSDVRTSNYNPTSRRTTERPIIYPLNTNNPRRRPKEDPEYWKSYMQSHLYHNTTIFVNRHWINTWVEKHHSFIICDAE